MATFEQRRAAIKRAAELVRNGPLPYRRAAATKPIPRDPKKPS